jgi:hypothetical protein
MKRFQSPLDSHRTNAAGIADLPPAAQIPEAKFDADSDSNDSSDLGGAEGTAQISLKHMEFSLTQFSKWMG